jgi:hypothetical protein
MLKMQGVFKVEHWNKGKLVGIYAAPNAIVDAGIHHMMETEFRSGTAVPTWYIGLVGAWTTWSAAHTMAGHAGWTESVAYSNATRPQWTCGAAATRTITNAVSVDFTINASATLKGLFITSHSLKVGAVGTLWSEGAFSSSVVINSGDLLKVTYTLIAS